MKPRSGESLRARSVEGTKAQRPQAHSRVCRRDVTYVVRSLGHLGEPEHKAPLYRRSQ